MNFRKSKNFNSIKIFSYLKVFLKRVDYFLNIYILNLHKKNINEQNSKRILSVPLWSTFDYTILNNMDAILIYFRILLKFIF